MRKEKELKLALIASGYSRIVLLDIGDSVSAWVTKPHCNRTGVYSGPLEDRDASPVQKRLNIFESRPTLRVESGQFDRSVSHPERRARAFS